MDLSMYASGIAFQISHVLFICITAKVNGVYFGGLWSTVLSYQHVTTQFKIVLFYCYNK